MEQFQVHGTAKSRAGGHRRQAITGVNASGNLEVLVERVLPDHECQVEVATAVTGFRTILGGGDRGILRARLAWWLAILDQRRRGASRHGYVTAHAERAADGGSGMSDLLQALRADWYEASARERIAGLLDAETFVEFLGPEQRATSPHLAQFDLTGAFDDGIVVGRGRLDGQQVLVAAQEGRFLGGAFGEVHGAKLIGLLRAARDGAGRGGPHAVLLLLDTGGVRLQRRMRASSRSPRLFTPSLRCGAPASRSWHWSAAGPELLAAVGLLRPVAAALSRLSMLV